MCRASPPRKPIIGNMLEVKKIMNRGLILAEAFAVLVEDYHEDDTFLIRFHGAAAHPQFITTDCEVVEWILKDETIWEKNLTSTAGPLGKIRKYVTPEGLFTNGTETHSWGLAHRILLPAFSMKGMRDYFPSILNQTSRMLKQWENFPIGYEIDMPDMMTRMTLDTIGKCGFDFEFDMIDNKEDPLFVHPFVHAMTDALGCTQELQKMDPVSAFIYGSKYVTKVKESRKTMLAIVDDVIDKRVSSGDRKSDILDLMLNAEDPETKEKLSKGNIIDQLITFLIAGHETTSGLLSFVWYLLWANPQVEERVIAEVDSVLGREFFFNKNLE